MISLQRNIQLTCRFHEQFCLLAWIAGDRLNNWTIHSWMYECMNLWFYDFDWNHIGMWFPGFTTVPLLLLLLLECEVTLAFELILEFMLPWVMLFDPVDDDDEEEEEEDDDDFWEDDFNLFLLLRLILLLLLPVLFPLLLL
jgi:hypothetical protein